MLSFPTKTLTFLAGQWQKAISVSVFADLLLESDEYVDVVLSNPTSGLSLRWERGDVAIMVDTTGGGG